MLKEWLQVACTFSRAHWRVSLDLSASLGGKLRPASSQSSWVAQLQGKNIQRALSNSQAPFGPERPGWTWRCAWREPVVRAADSGQTRAVCSSWIHSAFAPWAVAVVMTVAGAQCGLSIMLPRDLDLTAIDHDPTNGIPKGSCRMIPTIHGATATPCA